MNVLLASDCVELSAHVSEVNSDSWPSDANILRTADLESHKTLCSVAGFYIRIIGTDVF